MIPLSKADWSRVPFHLRRSLQDYVEEGHIPGRFMTGVLADRLEMTMNSSDPKGWRALNEILAFIHLYLPPESYGTPERVANWEATGGLDGVAVRRHLLKSEQRQRKDGESGSPEQ